MIFRCRPTNIAAKSCAHEFDQFQKFAEDPLTICPECGQEIRRVIQPVGVVFKGSGWYITDSRPASPESNGKRLQKRREAGGGENRSEIRHES